MDWDFLNLFKDAGRIWDQDWKYLIFSQKFWLFDVLFEVPNVPRQFKSSAQQRPTLIFRYFIEQSLRGGYIIVRISDFGQKLYGFSDPYNVLILSINCTDSLNQNPYKSKFFGVLNPYKSKLNPYNPGQWEYLE